MASRFANVLMSAKTQDLVTSAVCHADYLVMRSLFTPSKPPAWVSDWEPVVGVALVAVLGLVTIVVSVRIARNQSRQGAKTRDEDVQRASQAKSEARVAAAEEEVVQQIDALYERLLRMPDSRDYFRHAQPYAPCPSDVARYLDDLMPTIRWVEQYAAIRKFNALADKLAYSNELRNATHGAYNNYVSQLNQLLVSVGAGLHGIAPDEQPNFLLLLHHQVQFTLVQVAKLTTGKVEDGAGALAEMTAERWLGFDTIRDLAGKNWFPM